MDFSVSLTIGSRWRCIQTDDLFVSHNVRPHSTAAPNIHGAWPVRTRSRHRRRNLGTYTFFPTVYPIPSLITIPFFLFQTKALEIPHVLPQAMALQVPHDNPAHRRIHLTRLFANSPQIPSSLFRPRLRRQVPSTPLHPSPTRHRRPRSARIHPRTIQ